MREMGPNLAARPFANERPVKRTTLLIWILALSLLAVNVFFYQRHLAAHYEQRRAIWELEEQVEVERAAVLQGEAALTDLELQQQNEEVLFLNGQIDRRTFSWSLLFDRLEEVLPADVELQRVSPKILTDRRRARRRRSHDLREMGAIDMKGEADSGEELLQFVDNLFAHASFTLPDLGAETEGKDGRLEFTLNVFYLPQLAGEEAVEASQDRAEEAELLLDSTGGEG